MSDKTNPPPKIEPLDVSGGSRYLPPESGIGERIKAARNRPANDMSVEALSRMCRLCDVEGQGISRTTLLRYEAGTILPGAREIRILCDALDVRPDWLFNWRPSGDLPVDEVMQELSGIIKDRIASKDPLRQPASNGDVVRSMMLQQAKAPVKR
mgnify:CR=1 FL=1